MRTLRFLLLIACIPLILSDSEQAAGTVEIAAAQGKAADARTPDQVISEARLATRNGTWPDAKKSWLQFDLTGVYGENSSIQGNITSANLTFYGAKSETGGKSYVLSGLNDAAALEAWIAAALTWNNAPANDTASPTALQASLTTSLYTATVPAPVLNVKSETPEANRAALASFLNTDTDGKITFLFTPGGTTYLWNAGDPNGPVLTLTYLLGNNPQKAHDPDPEDDAVAGTSLASLSWTNPDPNIAGAQITCDVYFGTEPNLLTMDMVTLAAGDHSAAINTTNFHTYGTLVNDTAYYWQVDCHDPSRLPELIPGEMWSFFVGQAPTANAGPNQVVWLDPTEVTAALDGTTSDDGPYTVLWTQVANGAPTVTISPNNADDTSVTITQRGTYVFMLTADDTHLQTSDTVQVVVGTDSCDASVLSGSDYSSNDYDQDCDVDLVDFADFAADWLVCTNTLEGCL
jgi:hypothetical protein